MEKKYFELTQGDEYPIPFRITSRSGNAVTPIDADMVERIQFRIGNIEKEYPGDVEAETVEGHSVYMFPITEEESAGLSTGTVNVRVRVTFVDEKIKSALLTKIIVYER